MTPTRTVTADLVILGGGAAGLWLLDEARRSGFCALLLEAHQLGSGQTIASQGIIHGGLKYSLSGLLTPSAKAIAEMPVIWRQCLAGEREPDLSATRLRADFCYLWRSESLSGMLAMAGARAGLRVAPEKIAENQRPAMLRSVKGLVARLNEQVIDPAGFLHALADRNRNAIFKIDLDSGLEFVLADDGSVERIRLINPDTGIPLDLQPRRIALAAGAGNEQLAARLRLSSINTQRRPLHMVVARGDLPIMNGHCVDGASTRVTITSAVDAAERIVWQIGGQVSEVGVEMKPQQLIAHTVRELRDVLPDVDLSSAQWTTYRVDRAEAATTAGIRPDDAVVRRDGNVITAWPTKLALAPRLAELVLAECDQPGDTEPVDIGPDWPRPDVALPPWESAEQWTTVDLAELR